MIDRVHVIRHDRHGVFGKDRDWGGKRIIFVGGIGDNVLKSRGTKKRFPIFQRN